MAVYVDDMRVRFGRMKMCHMVADSQKELLEMAKKLVLRTRWIQAKGTPEEHFNISRLKRIFAIHWGAREVTCRGLVEIVRAKRPAPICQTCKRPLQGVGCCECEG